MFDSIKKFKVVLNRSLFLVIFSLALLGCGGGDDSSDEGNTNVDDSSNNGGSPANTDDINPPVSGSQSTGVVPVATLKTLNRTTFTNEASGVQIRFLGRGGSDGNILVVADENPDNLESAIPTVRLSDGISNINVANVRRSIFVDFSCEIETGIKGVISSNISRGTVDIVAQVNSETIACESNFQTPIPFTIFDQFSVKDLLENWGSDDDNSKSIEDTGLINTNCPQGNASIGSISPFASGCKGSILTNYIVTDANGRVHNLATKISFAISEQNGEISDIPKDGYVVDEELGEVEKQLENGGGSGDQGDTGDSGPIPPNPRCIGIKNLANPGCGLKNIPVIIDIFDIFEPADPDCSELRNLLLTECRKDIDIPTKIDTIDIPKSDDPDCTDLLNRVSSESKSSNKINKIGLYEI